MAALEYLMAKAVRYPALFKAQTPNARALATECISVAPKTVAGVFAAFDKASKAYGDLWLIYDLAIISTRAVGLAANLNPSPQESAKLAELRARRAVLLIARVSGHFGPHDLWENEPLAGIFQKKSRHDAEDRRSPRRARADAAAQVGYGIALSTVERSAFASRRP